MPRNCCGDIGTPGLSDRRHVADDYRSLQGGIRGENRGTTCTECSRPGNFLDDILHAKLSETHA